MVDIVLLIITGIFAVTAAIVICAGWGVACDTINDLWVYSNTILQHAQSINFL